MATAHPNEADNELISEPDDIDASRQSLIALFDGAPNQEAQELIEDLVDRYDPPIRVVQESTWALKAGGLVHCAVCQRLHGVRVELPRERAGRCPEHATWKILYRHNSWDAAERHEAALLHMKEWLEGSHSEQNVAHTTDVAEPLLCRVRGAETRWGDKKLRYRLRDEHNSWLTYLKIVLRRIPEHGEDAR
jgi:hypothetical protein